MRINAKWIIPVTVLLLLVGAFVLYYYVFAASDDSSTLPSQAGKANASSVPNIESSANSTESEDQAEPLSDDTAKTTGFEEIFEEYLEQEYRQSRELRQLLKVEIRPLANPPKEVQLTLKFDPERKYRMKRYVAACDEDGILVTNERQLIVNIGEQIGRVVSIDDETKLTTLRYEEKALALVWAGKNLPYPIEKKSNTKHTEYTYASDGTPVRAVINGQIFDSSKQARPIPFLTYPTEPVKPGTKWRCEAPANKDNYIEAQAKRFVDVMGVRCLEIEYRMQMVQGASQANSRVKVYVDIESSVRVREDSINKYVTPSPDGGEPQRSYMRVIEQLVAEP